MVSKVEIRAQVQSLPGQETLMKPPAIFIRDDYLGSKKLIDKVAIISGADSGIGRSAALHFAREGADIVVLYLSEEEDAQETARQVKAEGRRCLTLKGDLGQPATSRMVVDQTLAEFGKINILVNNAGTQQVQTELTDISDDQWRTTFQTNIDSIFYLTKAVLPHLKEDDAIINTASINAYIGPSILLDYSATKGAIISFTRSLSNQVVGRGIRVNAVAPGPVWTPLQPATLGAFDPQLLEDFGSDTPMGRAAQPWEIGPCYVFLASLDSAFISGQTLHPNGGTVVNG